MYIYTVISQGTSLENTPTSHAVSLALFMHAAVILQICFFVMHLLMQMFLPSFVTSAWWCKKSFFNKLHAAARFLHRLPYIHVR